MREPANSMICYFPSPFHQSFRPRQDMPQAAGYVPLQSDIKAEGGDESSRYCLHLTWAVTLEYNTALQKRSINAIDAILYTTHNQEKKKFPSNYAAQRVKIILSPSASLNCINVQWKAIELPYKNDPVPLLLHCTDSAKIWQHWFAMRRQVFTLYLYFILSYF